jgi:hypothetical protein
MQSFSNALDLKSVFEHRNLDYIMLLSERPFTLVVQLPEPSSRISRHIVIHADVLKAAKIVAGDVVIVLVSENLHIPKVHFSNSLLVSLHVWCNSRSPWGLPGPQSKDRMTVSTDQKTIIIAKDDL